MLGEPLPDEKSPPEDTTGVRESSARPQAPDEGDALALPPATDDLSPGGDDLLADEAKERDIDVDAITERLRKADPAKVVRRAASMIPSLFPPHKWTPALQRSVVRKVAALIRDTDWIEDLCVQVLAPMTPRWNASRAARALAYFAVTQALLPESDTQPGGVELNDEAEESS